VKTLKKPESHLLLHFIRFNYSDITRH